MYIVQKNHLRINANGYNTLRWLCHKCKNLYNSALYTIRTQYDKTGHYLTEKELFIALEFAQHYARTNNNPSPKEINKLVKYYGKDRSTDILNFIKMISIGNRLGKTIDAFESRMMGKPSQNSSFCFEFVIILLAGGPLMRKMMQKANFRPTFTK